MGNESRRSSLTSSGESSGVGAHNYTPNTHSFDDAHAGGSTMNFLAMRIGPGKHLQGRSLMGGVVSPEGYDHFHEVLFYLFCVVVSCQLIFFAVAHPQP